MATYQFARASHQYDAKGDTELSLLPGKIKKKQNITKIKSKKKIKT